MKKQNEVKRKQRNRYSAEYKRQAVLRSDQEGVEATAAALGLKAAQLYAWRSSQKNKGHAGEDLQLLRAELGKLRRENARLAEEAAFLKKAAAYFAKAPARGTP